METNPTRRPKPKLVRHFLRWLPLLIGALALCVTAYQLVMNLAFHAKLERSETRISRPVIC
jgi:hypothetical protein